MMKSTDRLSNRSLINRRQRSGALRRRSPTSDVCRYLRGQNPWGKSRRPTNPL